MGSGVGMLDGHGLDSSQLLYEQNSRRVKSISDIGHCVTSSGSMGACSLGGISASSESPE